LEIGAPHAYSKLLRWNCNNLFSSSLKTCLFCDMESLCSSVNLSSNDILRIPSLQILSLRPIALRRHSCDTHNTQVRSLSSYTPDFKFKRYVAGTTLLKHALRTTTNRQSGQDISTPPLPSPTFQPPTFVRVRVEFWAIG
jgi:hypothetical protein